MLLVFVKGILDLLVQPLQMTALFQQLSPTLIGLAAAFLQIFDFDERLVELVEEPTILLLLEFILS